MWQMSYDGGLYLSRQVDLIITTFPLVSMEYLSIRKLRKITSRSTRITNRVVKCKLHTLEFATGEWEVDYWKFKVIMFVVEVVLIFLRCRF